MYGFTFPRSKKKAGNFGILYSFSIFWMIKNTFYILLFLFDENYFNINIKCACAFPELLIFFEKCDSSLSLYTGSD